MISFLQFEIIDGRVICLYCCSTGPTQALGCDNYNKKMTTAFKFYFQFHGGSLRSKYKLYSYYFVLCSKKSTTSRRIEIFPSCFSFLKNNSIHGSLTIHFVVSHLKGLKSGLTTSEQFLKNSSSAISRFRLILLPLQKS